MASKIKKNKQGQTLGRKGLETRARLMEAARRLLLTQSPVELTAVAIAAEAHTSPASFYMYFDDTKDILFALSEVAGEDMAKVREIFDKPWDHEKVEKHATDVIEALNEVWNRHRAVLRYRNLEATRGDERFETLRMNTFMPFIERFAERILSINPAHGTRKRADAYAEASILHGAMEHLAATDPALTERYLGVRRINANLARIVAMVMKGEQQVANGVETDASTRPSVAAKPARKTRADGPKSAPKMKAAAPARPETAGEATQD
ncbi:MAG: TetR/AcrR family transcriptional regulator [Rhodocyclaceae bacterium]|nr:TetR/AcrR family transcriptional regulator [Rhodocyclaceae bacterium]